MADIGEIEEPLRRAVDEAPPSPAGLGARAAAAEREGDSSGALDLYQQALDLHEAAGDAQAQIDLLDRMGAVAIPAGHRVLGMLAEELVGADDRDLGHVPGSFMRLALAGDTSDSCPAGRQRVVEEAGDRATLRERLAAALEELVPEDAWRFEPSLVGAVKATAS